MPSPRILIDLLRRQHRLASSQVLTSLAVSRPTLMRMVKAAGSEVLTMGRARRTAYAARRPLRGSNAPLPVYRIDRHAAVEEAGQLHLAYPDGCVLEYGAPFEWPLDDDMRDGWFEGIPYPMQDLRPEGFLGRAFAREHAKVLRVNEDPRTWTDDDALYALSLLGADQSGNFIVGEEACRLWLRRIQQPPRMVTDADLENAYPALALQAMEHGMPDSSAGGEFPKFTAVRDFDGTPAHVIVKFSGSDDSPGTVRWADLLVCEHLASRCISLLPGLDAARTSVHRAGHRTFLEVIRFDRHGAHGRSALCSWAAFNNAWFGLAGRPWPESTHRLFKLGLIDKETSDGIARLWHFGQLIANTDMHDGNLSFMPGGPGLRLAPSYDMLPMLYAPQRGVELPEKNFRPQLPLPGEREFWQQAAAAAVEFWNGASGDGRISAGFRRICERNAQAVLDVQSHSSA
ncbi:type II toxin-antitoxin system HipA family toxin YjjJ [Azohydromonas aeria]|uniref:type II toxin-antitoxin system HipA family toxin YjjJ n=1 Tax=Azohydromonas aeria TaxID=2590212 RepID=UPI0012F9BEA8|nr:type II toxin-antitoxin system HipA family toxin YjjJ [Azohydromonas aeria]